MNVAKLHRSPKTNNKIKEKNLFKKDPESRANSRYNKRKENLVWISRILNNKQGSSRI